MVLLGWVGIGLFLISSAMVGVLLLRLYAPLYLTRVETVIFGPTLGVVLVSLLLLFLSMLLGLTTSLIYVVILFTSGAVVFLLRGKWPARGKEKIKPRKKKDADAQTSNDQWHAGGVVCSGFAVVWLIVYANAYSFDEQGVWARTIGLWADWALHLGDTMYFAEGAPLPPENPRYPGEAYAYHYLISFTAAVMVKLGASPFFALTSTSFLLSCVVALSMYAFFRRLSGDDVTSALAVALFHLAGGFGWLVVYRKAAAADSFWQSLFSEPWHMWQQETANYRLLNMYYALIHPQRGYLYGLPLAMLLFTLLWSGVKRKGRRSFFLAGLVAGCLPFAHLSTFLSVAMITPFLAALFWSRQWLWFFGTWVVLSVPQLFLQQGGVRSGAATLRWQPGWIAPPDNWVWFWLKNLGLFLPFLLAALIHKETLSPASKRFLFAFMPIFVIANLVVFQPWDWDNTKVLLYWMLASSLLIAALFMRLWRAKAGGVSVRIVLVCACLSMMISGLLVNANHVLGRERQFLLTGDELRLASALRERTVQEARFAVGVQHNHPVPMLSGRQVMMSYTGWLWSQGIDPSDREQDLRSIFRLQYSAAELLRKHEIDFVVIGPYEMNQMNANLEGFRAEYPLFLQIGEYYVFDVRPR